MNKDKFPNKFPYIVYSSLYDVHIFVTGKGHPPLFSSQIISTWPGTRHCIGNDAIGDTIGYPIELLNNSIKTRYYSMEFFINKYFQLI